MSIDQWKQASGMKEGALFRSIRRSDRPGKTSNRLLNATIDHWQVSGIVRADSGVPYCVFLAGDNEYRVGGMADGFLRCNTCRRSRRDST